MIKYFVISFFFIYLSLFVGCKKPENYNVQLNEIFTSYSNLVEKYPEIDLDSTGLFGEPKSGVVLDLELNNPSNKDLCVSVYEVSNIILNISTIKTKYPLPENPNNWTLSVLDNWKLNEVCLSPMESQSFIALYDYHDLSNDSVYINFTSSTYSKGLDLFLPSITIK